MRRGVIPARETSVFARGGEDGSTRTPMLIYSRAQTQSRARYIPGVRALAVMCQHSDHPKRGQVLASTSDHSNGASANTSERAEDQSEEEVTYS